MRLARRSCLLSAIRLLVALQQRSGRLRLSVLAHDSAWQLRRSIFAIRKLPVAISLFGIDMVELAICCCSRPSWPFADNHTEATDETKTVRREQAVADSCPRGPVMKRPIRLL